MRSAKSSYGSPKLDESTRRWEPMGFSDSRPFEGHGSGCGFGSECSGTLAEWREWTGLPFDATGDVVVPFALNPVHCSLEHDHAVYVEPGVWVHHRIGQPG